MNLEAMGHGIWQSNIADIYINMFEYIALKHSE